MRRRLLGKGPILAYTLKMPLSDADVQGVLKQLIDPNTGKDFLSTRSARNVKLSGNDVSLDLELGYPGKSQHEPIRRQVVRGARLLQRLDDLAANRLVLALARVAELKVERDVVAGELHVARRARAEEVLAGIRVYELLEDALNVRVTERHFQSVS